MSRFTYYQSPIGTITLQANNNGLLGAWLEIQTTQPDDLGQRDDHFPILVESVEQLTQYFAGQRQVFSLQLAAPGSTFQMQVWQVLTQIPYGQTLSYQDVANRIDNPKAVRAVGLAIGKNPISIIVPCHRVIGKSGELTGYAGGVERKEALLKLERVG